MEARDYINELPHEILIKIFTYLDVETILLCESVCKHWRQIGRDQQVWNHLTVVYSELDKHRERSKITLRVLSSHSELVRHLKLKYINTYSTITSILVKCGGITKLEISMCPIHIEFTNLLKKWPQLQLLHFSINQAISDQDYYKFEYDCHKHLTSISPPPFGLKENDFMRMLECKFLSHFFLSKVQKLSRADVLNILKIYKANIKSLQLYGGESVDDEVINIIGNLKSVRNIAIIRCENLTDQSLASLSSLNLEHLQLWNNSNFSENSIFALVSSPSLFRLNFLSFSRIKNVPLNIIKVLAVNYKYLRFFSVYQCPLLLNQRIECILKRTLPDIKIVSE